VSNLYFILDPILSFLHQLYAYVHCAHPKRPVSSTNLSSPSLCTAALFGQKLNALNLPIRLPGINLLARLRNRLQHRLVRERGLSNNSGGLCVEGDVVGFNACRSELASSFF
jgi:hypothetical protein